MIKMVQMIRSQMNADLIVWPFDMFSRNTGTGRSEPSRPLRVDSTQPNHAGSEHPNFSARGIPSFESSPFLLANIIRNRFLFN